MYDDLYLEGFVALCYLILMLAALYFIPILGIVMLLATIAGIWYINTDRFLGR